MAKPIQAVTEFGPRIALGRTAQTPEIAKIDCITHLNERRRGGQRLE